MTQATEARFLQHAQATGADAVCIRSDNKRLAGAVARFRAKGFKVYAWRWPAMKPTPGSTTHYYATDEAQFVVETLLPAGLDGYIMDPESENDGASNDWNNATLGPLAKSFCQTIRAGASAAGLGNFVFGVTSGCDYPTSRKLMPWHELVAASDALFPQTYWRWTSPKTGKPQGINGGTPDKAIDKGLESWKTIANGTPVIPMAGEIDVADVTDFSAYAARLKKEHVGTLQFYADNSRVSQAKCAAIRAI
jgi:hypothetical protein